MSPQSRLGRGQRSAALFDHIDLDSHLNLLPDPATGLELSDGIVNVIPGAFGHGAALSC